MIRDTAHLRLVTPAPTGEEAAAIVAALEHFKRQTTSASPALAPTVDGWRAAAALEGIDRADHHDLYHPWINT
jgi:hypothetical protein